MGVLGLGVDHEDRDIDVALEHVGHEPEALLTGRAEQEELHSLGGFVRTVTATFDAERAEVERNRRQQLDRRLVAGRRHVGRDHGRLRHRLDEGRLAGRERAGHEDLEDVVGSSSAGRTVRPGEPGVDRVGRVQLESQTRGHAPSLQSARAQRPGSQRYRRAETIT